MPFPTGYALGQRDWDQVLQVLGFQAEDDGIDTADFGAMLELFRTGFELVSDARLRRRFLDNRSPTALTRQEADAQSELMRVQSEIAQLPPDPGPVPPR